jgi:hypothetical protein
MHVDRWFSVFAFAATGCLAAPGPEGSGPQHDKQGHVQGAGSEEPELSFVAGLTCTHHADCGRRSYCEYNEGQCDGSGVCRTRLKACPPVDVPVCGCDGRTYANACAAAGAGVSIKHADACNPGEPCGAVVCEQDLECCNASCGICVARGGACTQEACESIVQP